VKTHKFLILVATILALVPAAFAGVTIVDVAVTKSGPSTINRGADITYIVTVTNAGNTPATTVQMTDPLPPGITFTSLAQSGPVFACSTPPAGSNGTVSCSIATLNAGATTTFTLVGSVPGSATGGTTYANTATATTTSADSNGANNSQTSTATVNPLADVGVTKAAPSSATAGSDVSFSIQVMNNGPDDAATVSLTDPLPAGMNFVSDTQNSGPAFSCSNPSAGTNGTITCTIATLPAGSIATFTFVANIPPATPPGSTFSNTATVSTATFDPNDENDSSTGNTTIPAPSADLRVQKNGPVSALANSDVAYSITVINAGPDAAVSVSLTDTLPGTMTFVSIVQNSGPAFDCTSHPAVGSGGTVTCTIATLASGTSTFTLTGHIPSGTAAGTTFTNIANVNSTGDTPTADPDPTNNQSPTTLTVGSSDLAITKSGPATATAGGTIAWTITVTNNGPDAEQNASFADTLPAGTTFNSLVQNTGPATTCGAPAPNTPGTVNCSFPPLNSSDSAQFTLTVNISPSFTGTLNNTASVTGDNTDTNTSNNSQTASATVSASADLTINKSGPASANAGTDITYTVTLTNSGPSAAASVSLTDAVPANTTFVSESQTAGPTFSCITPAPGGTGTITCTLGSFGVGSATFSITVHINPGATGTITNTANVSSSTTDPNPSGNNPTATTTVTASADLSVVKTATSAVTAGNNVTYHIVVTNNGPSDATAVNMSDTLPPNTTFVSETQTGGPSFTCTNPSVGGTGTVSCSIATLTSGTTATFDIVAKFAAATPTGPSNNTATVSTTTPDPNPNNNSQTASVTVSGSADLTINKSGPATATAGTNITYTVTLTNSGPSTAASVSLTDAVPANTTFVSESQTNGPIFSCSTPAAGGTGTITCSIGSFPMGSATFSITVHINPGAPGTVTNTANVATPTPDPNPNGNTPTVVTTIATSADLSIVKTATSAVSAGNNVTYQIVVTNNGPSDATAVNMSDTLPPNTTFVSETQTGGPSFTCTNPAVGGTGAVSCSIATLTSGTTATFDIVAKSAAATPAGPSNNTATVSTTTPDPNSGNNSSTAVTQVSASLADLSIAKTPAPGPYGTGQPLTYTIVVTNSGPSSAAAVTVTDTLPAGTTLQSSTPSGACTGTTIVTCNAGTLALGASVTFTLTIALPSTAGVITNTAVASASAANPDPNLGNNTATSTITVIPAANIPMISPLSLLLLCLALALAGAFVQKS
jgi:uncharacterized repeat protein (TIGR01451 family)